MSKGMLVPAGPWRRAAALAIDVLILLVSLVVITPTVYGFQDYLPGAYDAASAPQIFRPRVGVTAIVGVWLLFALLRSSARQLTYGKQMVGIKIVNARRTGWRSAILRFSIFVCKALLWAIPFAIVFSISVNTYAVMTARATVSEVLHAMRPLQEKIAKQGCQAGNRFLSSAVTDTYAAVRIAAIDVTNTGPESCTIAVTLSGKRYNGDNAAPVNSFPAGLTGKQLQLTGSQNGEQWTCSSDSDIDPLFFPPECRDQKPFKLHPDDPPAALPQDCRRPPSPTLAPA